MIVYIDIDNVICNTDNTLSAPEKYIKAVPIQSRIDKINALYDEGHQITFWTSRENNTNEDSAILTLQQLKSWGCKFHSLKMNKPHFDLFIDANACSAESWSPK